MVISSRRQRRLFRIILSYLLALLLPPIATWITVRVQSLHSVPFALHFIILAGIVTLGGIYPALFGFIVAVVTRNYMTHLAAPVTEDALRYNLLRSAIILTTILIIGLINARLHKSEKDLETALDVLQERTDDLIASLHSSKCASWVHDRDGERVTRFYSGSYEIFGRPFAEIHNLKTMVSMLSSEDQKRLPSVTHHFDNSLEPLVFEYRSAWPNGEIHVLEMRATRVPGPRRLWRGVTVDITERKQAEAALLRAEKLAAMGRLASTVAHEINNPLEAVTNLLYLARSSHSTEAEAGAYLTAAERELARLSNITRLTLGFVRTSASSTEVDVATIIDEVLAIFRHRLESRDVRIDRHFQPDVCVVIAPHELRQVLTNLIANAADAVTEGTICIRVMSEQSTAVILVEDSGSGIADAHLSRIFEPFFSTKEEIGTGIGLWVTKELTEKNGGRISVETAGLPIGIQTRFRVEFPLAAQISVQNH